MRGAHQVARKPSTPSSTKNVSAVSGNSSKNQDIDGVLSGVAWNTDPGSSLNGTLSFSFPDASTDYGKAYGSSEHRKNFGSFLTPDEQLAFYNVLAGLGGVTTDHTANLSRSQYLSTVTTLTFTEFGERAGDNTDKDALLRFGKTDMNNVEAWAYYPSSRAEGGDAWFSNQYMNFGDMQIGTYDYTVLLHETGQPLA
jgi:serralysin